MSKKASFVVAFSFIATFLQAQEFYQSLGSTVSIQYATLFRGSTRVQDRFAVTHFHLNYFPRVGFPLGDNSSISLGAPIGVGPAFIDNNFMQVKGTFLSYEIPIVADYNIGFKTNKDPGDDMVGFYFGGGFSMMRTNLDSIADTKFKPSSAGLLGRIGTRLRFPVSDKFWGLNIGLHYKLGMGEEKFKTMGFNLFLDF